MNLKLIIFVFILPILLCSCSNTSIKTNLKPFNLLDEKKFNYSVYYIGLALWGNSEPWSENDIVDLENILQNIYSKRNFYSYIFSNRINPSNSKYIPYSKLGITKTIKNLSNSSKENDIIIISISSHGFPNGLSYKVGMSKSKEILANDIKELLQPLEDNNILMIISACFSGSLIRHLKNNKKIIITAASAKNSSFGCEKDSPNSWFVESLKQAYDYDVKAERFSIIQWFKKAKILVQKKEKEFGHKESSPQIFIGKDINPFVFLL